MPVSVFQNMRSAFNVYCERAPSSIMRGKQLRSEKEKRLAGRNKRNEERGEEWKRKWKDKGGSKTEDFLPGQLVLSALTGFVHYRKISDNL